MEKFTLAPLTRRFDPQPKNYIIALYGTNGELLVTIDEDGNVEVGVKDCESEAADVFWDCLRESVAARPIEKCPRCEQLEAELETVRNKGEV